MGGGGRAGGGGAAAAAAKIVFAEERRFLAHCKGNCKQVLRPMEGCSCDLPCNYWGTYAG
jgi:hypothetical protein